MRVLISCTIGDLPLTRLEPKSASYSTTMSSGEGFENSKRGQPGGSFAKGMSKRPSSLAHFKRVFLDLSAPFTIVVSIGISAGGHFELSFA